MARGRKGNSVQSKIGMLLYGEQFTGKSSLALQLAYFKRPDGKPFRILYLDAEAGSIDDYLTEMNEEGIVNTENIYVLYTQSLGEVRQYIAKVRNNEDFYYLDDDGEETDEVVLDADGQPFRADAIVVDGTTILNMTTKQGLVEFSKKRNKVKADTAGLLGDARLVKIEGAGLELKDYNNIAFKGNDFILDLMACGAHYIVTARETDEKVTVKQEDGSTTSVVTGKKIPEGFKGLGYNVKTEIRMFRNEEGIVCAHVKKDRTHVHEDNSIVEDPTLLDWQAVIDRTAKHKSFVIKNDLTKAVEVEQDIYSKEVLGKVGDPVDELPTSETNPIDSIDSIKKEITSIKSSLPTPKKVLAKTALEKAGLPTNFSKITDKDVLKKAFDVLVAVKNS